MPTIGRDPNKTRAELAAGESGAQAVQGASSTLQRAYEANTQAAAQATQTLGGLAQQGEELKVSKGRAAEDVRSNRVREAIAEEGQDIEMADKGLQRTGPSRADQVRQEMERGRLQTQGEKPVEVPGPGRSAIAQTQERVAEDRQKAETAGMNARARMADAMRRSNQARLAGDEEGAKLAAKDAQQHIESAANLFSRFNEGRPSEEDWRNARALATQFGNQHPDPAIQAEIDSGTYGPRLRDFLRANMDNWSLRYVAQIGELPDGKLVSLDSPVMGALTQTATGIKSYLSVADGMLGGMLSRSMGIKSLGDRNRIINKLAADSMLKYGEMQQMQQRQQQNPIPSQGGPSARPQQQPGPPGAGPAGARPARTQREIGAERDARVLERGFSGGGPR